MTRQEMSEQNKWKQKHYRMFRAESGGIMLQHPDDPDALSDGETLEEAIRIMHLVEKVRGLTPVEVNSGDLV